MVGGVNQRVHGAGHWLSLLIGVATLAACGDSGSPAGKGAITLGVTDAPIDEASSVVVQFNAVAFKREGSGTEALQHLAPAPRQIDLLQLQDGRAAVLLDGLVLSAGHYEWVRLIVDDEPNVRDSFLITRASAECELRIPSGAETGLKLSGGFTLPADGSVALTVDFDLHQSLHAPPGQQGSGLDCTQAVLLRPTLRLVDNANAGAIAGLVDARLVSLGCLPKVYVFAGANAVPDDIEDSTTGTDIDPLTVAAVHIVSGAIQFAYQAAFIPAGEYSVAFTCSDDDPTADEAVTFLPVQNVIVQPNVISTVNFAPAL